MNRIPFLYLGVLVTVTASFLGLVSLPHFQIGALEPIVDEQGNQHPARPEGLIKRGRAEYVGLGCVYCHSQQVRPPGFGSDIDRGWGLRRSVARDYIHDVPHLLGTMRTGPDLAALATRQPSQNWHYLHLYHPPITSPGSVMPDYRYLFEHRRIEAQTPFMAIEFPDGILEQGTYVVPTIRGEALVAYLISLDQSYPVPEAP